MKIYRPLSDQWAVFLDGKIKSAGWVAGDASLDRSLTDSIGLAMTKHASTKRDGTIHIRIGDLSSYAILTRLGLMNTRLESRTRVEGR